jgi:hypothetical protein
MPCISRFRGIVIAIYHEEHPPPHFHARYSGAEASIRIDPLTLLKGGLPPRPLDQVLQWAAHHQDELLAAWRRAQAAQAPGQIPPLP